MQTDSDTVVAVRSETVLLVDDDKRLRAAARRLLVRGGYWVIEAESGAAALALAATHPAPIDVLLTDVAMPDLSGPKLAAALSAQRPALRIVLMSGYAGGAAARWELDPSVAFLQKPFSPTSLLGAIRRAPDPD